MKLAQATGIAMMVNLWHSSSVASELKSRSHLTEDEVTLLCAELEGLSSKQIAKSLGLAPDAIDCRFQRICAKLRTKTRREALRIAVAYGYIDDRPTGPRSLSTQVHCP